MSQETVDSLPDLYETDETAWLDATANLIRQGRLGEIDYPHLEEYLGDMARRDRREVKNRLTVLIMHVLKWTYQADKRSASWRRTVIAQRQALSDLLTSGVLRRHAETVLNKAYLDAVDQTVAETELPDTTFPKACPYTLDQLLMADFLGD